MMKLLHQRLIWSTVTVLAVVEVDGAVEVDGIFAGSIVEHTVIGCIVPELPPKKRRFIGISGMNSTLQNFGNSIFLVCNEINSAF